MNIICNEEKKLFALETNSSTYLMQVGPSGELLHVCYSGKIDCTDDLSTMPLRGNCAFSASPESQGRSNSLNVMPTTVTSLSAAIISFLFSSIFVTIPFP